MQASTSPSRPVRGILRGGGKLEHQQEDSRTTWNDHESICAVVMLSESLMLIYFPPVSETKSTSRQVTPKEWSSPLSEQSSSLPVALGLALFKALLIGVRTWNVLTITLDLQKHHLPVRAVLLINSELFHHREESLIPPEEWEVCWVSQKVCLGFFITSYGKTQTNILANIFSPYKDQAKGSLKALAFDNLIQLHREVLFTFLIVRPNLGLPHCRQILSHLSHQGSPRPQNKASEIKD